MLALLLGFVLSWSLIGPIQRIDSRLAGIASGDFSRHVDVDNRDELGALGANVNRMNDELRRLYRELEAASRHKSRVPGQHVARAADAAERDPRLLAGAARGDVRRGEREAEGVPRRHPLLGQPPALAHQRRPRPVEGRGRADRARGRAVLAPRRARARRRHGARAGVEGRRPVALATAPEVDVVDGRRAADQAGDLQPALERREVHARGRVRRRERGEGQRRGARRGRRHRPGPRARGPRADLRGVPADGDGHRAARGNRPRARAFEAVRRAARRPHLGRQRARQGKHFVFTLPAGRPERWPASGSSWSRTTRRT